MRERFAVIGTAAVMASLGALAGLAAGQAVQPRPGPGREVITVEGAVAVTNTPTVAVTNTPTVFAAQSGDWRVTMSNLAPTRLAAPSFLKEGQTYRMTWPSGQQEEVTVKSAAEGWVLAERVEGSARVPRWVNAAMAVAIEAK
jgi:hypothetical protein